MTTENFGGAPHNETRTPEQSGAATGDGAVNSKERAPIYFKGEITIVPISFEDACVFVANHHRHHQPPVGHKFSIGLANDDGEIIGVAICGRPVARMSDNGWTIEVTRCCTIGTPNACSMLYTCPDCGMLCYCGGDIDDCEFDGTPEQDRCGHCPPEGAQCDDDPTEIEDNRQFKTPIVK